MRNVSDAELADYVAALAVAALTELLGTATRVFAGHGGVELPINLGGGCVGLIPAPELLDRQVRIYELLTASEDGSRRDGMARHGEILPWIVMMARGGVEAMLFYGKRLMAARLELPVPVMRTPTIEASPYGLREVGRMFEALGAL